MLFGVVSLTCFRVKKTDIRLHGYRLGYRWGLVKLFEKIFKKNIQVLFKKIIMLLDL